MSFRLLLILGSAALAARAAGAAPPAAARTAPAAHAAGPARAPQDSAESLYRAARAALSDGDYDRAAEGFRDVSGRFPRSARAADALYYEAFARYRAGGSRNLRAALAALDTQRRRYADAATRADAAALATRVRGELARGGDAEAAATVADDARAAASACPRGRRGRARGRAQRARPDGRRPGGARARARARPPRRLLGAAAPQGRVPAVAAARRRDGRCAAARRPERPRPRGARAGRVLAVAGAHPARHRRARRHPQRQRRPGAAREGAVRAVAAGRRARPGRCCATWPPRRAPTRACARRPSSGSASAAPPRTRASCAGLYGQLRDAELKEKVLFSLSQMRGQGNERWLLDVAQDTRESLAVRKKAIFGAQQAGVGVDQLGALYGRLGERELREQVIFALSQERGPRRGRPPHGHRPRDQDADLRKKAIFWLGQSRDPRAAQFLASLLDR
jgi:hypothetical protein